VKIQQATTHDNIFHATGDVHLTNDGIFGPTKEGYWNQIMEFQKE